MKNKKKKGMKEVMSRISLLKHVLLKRELDGDVPNV